MRLPRILAAGLALTFSLAACSEGTGEIVSEGGFDQAIDQQTVEAIRTALEGARSDLTYEDIKPSPIAGYYQVRVGSEVLYVSENAEHFFVGTLYGIQPGQFVDITESQRAGQRLEMLAQVDPDTMIVFPASGETKGVLTVFTDVTCGFCRKLHEQMAEMNAAGIEVHYLAYPRSGIERNGVLTHEYTETAKAWCADDRANVLTRLKAGEMVPGEVCEDNPVADHYALGRQFGVTGTPAILLPDGVLVPGFRSTADYLNLLGVDPE